MALLDDLFGMGNGLAANPMDGAKNALLTDLLKRMDANASASAAPAPMLTGGDATVAAAPQPEALPPLVSRDLAPSPAPGLPYAAPAAATPAAMPTAAPAKPAAPYAASFGDRVQAFGRALQGQDPGDLDRANTAKNETFNFLTGKGVDPQQARAMISNPALLAQALPGLFPGRMKPELTEIYDAQGNKQKVLLNPQTGDFKPLGGAATRPDAYQVIEVYDDKGNKQKALFDPRSGATKPMGGAAPNAENKAPSGFEWVDPSDHGKGLRAIAGGPGTHVSSELAGKLALMDAAQAGMKKTSAALLSKWGAMGSAQSMAANVPFVGDIAPLSGEIGIATRDVRANIEAALRVMTGAAAPEQEVQRYMGMFMPGIKDTAESAKQKLELLDQFTNNARELAYRGRGAPPAPGGAAAAPTPGAGGPKPEQNQALTEARAAIAAGKDPDAVRARLQQWGYALD